jgi:hypothetical protein
MRARVTNRKGRREAGIALLISIFVLLLISVVAIALVVSSGTESALAGNYRASTGVYYSALSGLEEARGRLLTKNPDAFKTTNPAGFLPPTGTALNMGDTYYLINPVGGELVTPWDSSSTYPDTQFQVEFGPSGFAAPTNPSPTALSVWNRNPLLALNLPGALYKWVRINAVSEKSLGVDADGDGVADATTPLYFDGVHFSDNSSAGPQVLELTSFATLGNGSQKLLQYLVVPVNITLPPFPAALTLAGNMGGTVVGYSAPASNAGFWIKGTDQDCTGNPTGSAVPAISVLNFSDVHSVTAGITLNVYGTPVTLTGIPHIYQSQYPGTFTTPSIMTVNGPGPSFPANFQTPAGLDAVAQALILNADATVPTTSGTAERTFLTNLLSTNAMSSTSPLTVVVNGDLDLTGWNHTGYGLLLVTGTLTYDPDASWDGIVMVVGQGQVIGWKGGSGEFDGAMLVARTRDNTGILIPGSALGDSYVDFNHSASMGGNGIRYSNCWIQKSLPTTGYKILSFHEITQ